MDRVYQNLVTQFESFFNDISDKFKGNFNL